jgi:GNAT superfamily N-acetyltransferase
MIARVVPMPDNSWTIREASSAKDWEGALQVLTSVYIDEIEKGLSRRQEAQTLFSRSHLKGKGDFLVAADSEGRILGAVLLLSEHSELRQIARPQEAEFRILAVGQPARGKGVGHALVEECIARAKRRGARRLVLSTQPFMHAAMRLYERLKFKRQSDRDWHTPKGSPRWVYSIELDSNA